jgi:hypothetical protein
MSGQENIDMGSGLSPEDDFYAPEKTDAFIEGMAVYAADPRTQTSFTLILYATQGEVGREAQNRATVSVNLPDGRVAASIEVGGARGGKLARSSKLSFEQIEPFRRWRYRFDDLATVVPQEESLRRVIDEAPSQRIAFDLAIECVTPAWRPPATVFASAGAAQPAAGPRVFGFYVQNHRFSGWVQLGAQRLEVSGTGWRHHVRASPWGDEIAAHHFIHVLFASGRAVGLQVAELANGQSSRVGYVFEDGVLSQAKVREISGWGGLRFSGEVARVVLEVGPRTVEIRGETLNNVSVSTGNGGFGIDYADTASRFMTFADTRWTWGDEVGYGTWERSIRLSDAQGAGGGD